MLRALARPGASDRPYDCIFIDSFHTYRSTAIDLAGAFALLSPGGAIVMHDCNPANAALGGPAFKKGAWCGVTYAAFIDFVLRRDGITYYTVDADHGCGVILRQPPMPLGKAAERVRDHLAFEWETCRGDDDAQFRMFDQNRTALLNLISPEAFLERENVAEPLSRPIRTPASALAPAAAAAESDPTPLPPPPRTASGTAPGTASVTAPATRWWQSRTIIRHINGLICGKPLDGVAAGDAERLQSLAAGTPFARALSVSGGNVQNEIRLLQAGVVTEFDLFETCERQAASARHRAENAGVGRRLHIHLADALAGAVDPGYHLVYWKDSLRRLADVTAAITWSRAALKSGGVFFANEYVGPSRRQYTDCQLALARRARAALPESYLANPHALGELLALQPHRPDAAAVQKADPHDCADTGAILQAVRTLFPDARITPTGGVVYLIALSDVLANMDETADEALLRAMLLADEFCIEAGESLYAAIDARA